MNHHGIHPLYAEEIEKHVEALFEALVRHDENIKALTLMEQCVPYFLANSERIAALTAHQQEVMVHVRDDAAYTEYYGNNPHEAPFEQMFSREVSEAHTMPRVAWLKGKIEQHGYSSVLDLACNDGAILRFLCDSVDSLSSTESLGVDLNPACVQRAVSRGVRAVIGRCDTATTTFGTTGQQRGPEEVVDGVDRVFPFDAAFAGEVIEHVPDPVALLCNMAAHAPNIYVTTPYGATEKGLIDNWLVREPKGHVRSPIPQDLINWCGQAGLTPVEISLAGGDTLCLEAQVTSLPVHPDSQNHA